MSGGVTVGSPMVTVGVDTVRVSEIEGSIDAFGARYVDRVYTAGEQRACAGPARARGLAARFAAKEAVLKALRPSDLPGPWTAIELVRASGGAPDVRLHGAAAAHAARAGISDVSVSITHDGDLATAVAVAIRTDQGDTVCPKT